MIDSEQVQTNTAWIYNLAEILTQERQKQIALKIHPNSSRSSNWASSLGHPCELHLTYWRTQGEKANSISTTTAQIFEEGKKQEDLILRELEELGVHILARGIPIPNDSFFRELNIHGAIDAKLDCEAIAYLLKDKAPQIDWERKKVVAECKAIAPHSFDTLIDYDAIMVAKQYYVRAWAEQMQLYLLGHNDEAGLFVFKNKVTGELRFIPVVLDLETCEALAQKAKRINTAVEAYHKTGQLPSPIEWHSGVCPECPFLFMCENGRVLPESQIVEDKELIELLARKEQLQTATREMEEVKERIDHKLEGLEGKALIIGDYQVRWSKIERAEKVVPANSYWTKRFIKLPLPVKK